MPRKTLTSPTISPPPAARPPGHPRACTPYLISPESPKPPPADRPRKPRPKRHDLPPILTLVTLVTLLALPNLAASQDSTAVDPGASVAPRWESSWLAATLRDAAQHADTIHAGEVIEVTAFPAGPQGQPGIHTRITLRTDPTLLGEDGAPEEVDFWMPGGRLGNRIRLLTGQVRFELGETVAVLLYTTAHGTLWPASLARSKWRVEADHLSLPNTRGHLSLDRFRALIGAIHRSGP